MCESADLSIGKVCFFRFGIENNYITSGDRQFLAMAPSGFQVGNRKFQGLETEGPCHLKSFLSGVYASVIDLLLAKTLVFTSGKICMCWPSKQSFCTNMHKNLPG